MFYDKYLDAAALLGKTILTIKRVRSEAVHITTSDGFSYRMFHDQDCCESVHIHDVRGSLEALIGSPLVEAREKSSTTWPEDVEKPEYLDSFTWTTYWFSTDTHKVRIRWLGESNGYYNESVQIDEIAPESGFKA